MTFYVGDVATFELKFYNSSKVLFDPPKVTVEYETPEDSGTYEYEVDAELIRTGTGEYEFDLSVLAAGRHEAKGYGLNEADLPVSASPTKAFDAK